MTSNMKCIQMEGMGQLKVGEQPIPQPGEKQVLVKIFAAGQNPVDSACTHLIYSDAWKHHVPGCDISGVVEAVDPNVTRFSVGDKIASIVPGAITTKGAYAEYVLADEGLAVKVPDGISFEDAAALGVAINTASLVFFSPKGFGFKIPSGSAGGLEGSPFILIVGGSSGSGTMAIQIAKSIGARPIVLCSSKNFGLVESYGAEKTYDYAEEGVGKKIKEFTNDSLGFAIICVSSPSNQAIIEESMSSKGGKVVLVPTTAPSTSRTDITYTGINGFEVFTDDFSIMGTPVPFNKESREACEKGAIYAQELLAQGALKTHPTKTVPGGLDGIAQSFRDFFDGKIRAFKPVFRIADTASFKS